jgi:hypothetical protein
VRNVTQLPNQDCVVKVGGGRGFIIVNRVKMPALKNWKAYFVEHRLIVTAAHCLPKLPPACSASLPYERTYEDLLGTLDQKKKGVWAECVFADPVADIAVLGCPDEQALYDEAEEYRALTDGAAFLRIGTAQTGTGWMLSLKRRWISSRLVAHGISLETGPTKGGMSGSPILNSAGQAVGVVSIGTTSKSLKGRRIEDRRTGPQPILASCLPGWLLSKQA